MTFRALPFTILFASFAYLILVTQVASGFPPFYRPFIKIGGRPSDDEFIKGVVLTLIQAIAAGACVSLVALFVAYFLDLSRNQFGYAVFLIAAISFLYSARSIRSHVRATTDGPMNWLLTPHFPKINLLLLRYPMLVFDLWTLGWAACFGMLIYLM